MCVATTRDIYYKGASYNAKQLAWTAAKLIRLCPRLRALSSPTSLWERGNTVTSNGYSQFLQTALMKMKDSLECLEWRSPWGLGSTINLSRLVLPHLKLMLLSSDDNYPYASSDLPVRYLRACYSIPGTFWTNQLQWVA
jgi:hypothetical protein